MAKTVFTQPSTDITAQLSTLKLRGLKIDNEDKVLHLLEHISYFRLSVSLRRTTSFFMNINGLFLPGQKCVQLAGQMIRDDRQSFGQVGEWFVIIDFTGSQKGINYGGLLGCFV